METKNKLETKLDTLAADAGSHTEFIPEKEYEFGLKSFRASDGYMRVQTSEGPDIIIGDVRDYSLGMMLKLPRKTRMTCQFKEMRESTKNAGSFYAKFWVLGFHKPD